MMHFYDKRKHKPQPLYSGYLNAWCGRVVRQNQATSNLTFVHCRQCREAFAAVLRKLPDYDESNP